MSSKTYWVSHDGGFFFRLLGYGLSCQVDMPVLFSEREGHRRLLRIGRFSVEFLRPL